jgi:hypothetical protein
MSGILSCFAGTVLFCSSDGCRPFSSNRRSNFWHSINILPSYVGLLCFSRMMLKNPQLYGADVCKEAADGKKLPKLKLAQEGDLRREVDLAGQLYMRAIVGRRLPEWEDLSLYCSTAAPVFATYLRRTLAVKAEPVIGLYLHESSKVQVIDKKLAEVSSEAAKALSVKALSQRSLDRVRGNPDARPALNQLHEFVIVPAEGGEFYFIDPTYRQFDETVKGCVIDKVDAKTLKEKYGIVLLPAEDQKKRRLRGVRLAVGKPLKRHEDYDEVAKGILDSMLEMRGQTAIT